MYKLRVWAVAFLLFSCDRAMAAAGDTTVVPVFQNQVIITNPNTGSNPYHQWGVFPGQSVSYNKVLMYLTFECPNNMDCAEWDYLDPISIRRINGVNGDTLNWEIARFITPYGLYWTAGSSFKHGWYYDITDFASLLHDSVEIEYNHTGFEGTSRGWKININFIIIEGTPEREIKNITRIYSGGYAYNSNTETNLSAQSVTFGSNTQEARIKIIQSGHGMDQPENCSEFCPKERWVKYDGNTVNQRIMWRECGFNSLFPQAGTWLYDRGNWCPGASVRYDDIDLHNVNAGSNHTFDIDMEAVGAGSYGTQVITAYVIEYGASNYTTEVSLEGILAPSKEYEATRINPICAEPKIVIKNNGTNALTSLDIVYGVQGGVQSTYQWTGNLPYLGVDTVVITQPVNWTSGSNIFQVDLQNPNGSTDQFIHNNYGAGIFADPPVLNYNTIVIVFQTNNAPSENHYRFINLTTGTIVSQKTGFINPASTYRDTINLSSGHCYRFEFYDDGPPPSSNPLNNDGLNWWANPSDGAGSVKFTMLTSPIPIKAFESDFGNKFYFEFMCKFPLSITTTEGENISMIIAPNPSAEGIFNIDYTLPDKQGILEVYNMIGLKVAAEPVRQQYGQMKLNLQNLPKGMYIIKMTSANKLVQTQRIISQ
jgi:hypothetical protein